MYPSSVKDLLSSFNKDKDKFNAHYKELQKNHESKRFYLSVLSELKNSVLLDKIHDFKKLSKIIEHIRNLETEKGLQNVFKQQLQHPFQKTNLIILACQHNSENILAHILKNFQIVKQISIDLGKDEIFPFEQDEKSHNSFYYAIQSENTKLVEILVSEWPGRYFENHLEELEKGLSASYREIKLKRVPLSTSMEAWVLKKLFNLRYVLHVPTLSQNTDSLDDIKKRLKMVIEQINLLVLEYESKDKEIDDKFLCIAKFIALNVHILKWQLKCTYDLLPWEEIEFILCVFVASHNKLGEINLFNHALLKKDQIVRHLRNFVKKIAEEDIFKDLNASKLFVLPRLNRESVVKKIIKLSPEFEELYNDYTRIRDIHTLNRINYYINLALLTNVKEREGQIIIIRAIQVIGEHIKNTLESPKLSNQTSELLLLSLTRNSREVLIELRNSLSHADSFSKRLEIEKNEDVSFFIGIQKDLGMVGKVIFEILLRNKINIIRMLLNSIINSTSLHELREVCRITNYLQIDNTCKTLGTPFQIFIQKLNHLIDIKNPYEKNILDEIINECSQFKKSDYSQGITALKGLAYSLESYKNDEILFLTLQSQAKAILENFSEKNSNTLKRVMNLSQEASNSLSFRLQNFLEEQNTLCAEAMLYNMEFKENIKWIEKLREKLIKREYFKNTNKPEKQPLAGKELIEALNHRLFELDHFLKKMD